MIKKKSYEELLASALGYLQAHSDISMTAPGSVTRTLVESVVNEIVGVYNTTDTALKMAYVSTSGGFFLDLLGEMVGVTRRTENYAYVRATDRNIRFYVNTGTLGDLIPKSGDPTKCQVPDGTTIESADGNVVFVVDADHEAPASATEIWVTARAQTVGTASNMGTGTLVTHSLADGVLVENVNAITTGQGLEDDETFRFRIRNAVLATQGANRISIEDIVIQVPGVADAIMNEFSMGAGSFEVLLIPDGNRVPTEALLQVRSAVSGAAAYGVDFNIREPRYVPIALDVEIEMPRANDVDKPLLRDLVSGRISTYVGGLRPQETLRVGRIREAALGVSTLITDIHIRSMRIGGRPQLISDYVLAPDEIFIPDPEEDSPFQVR